LQRSHGSSHDHPPARSRRTRGRQLRRRSAEDLVRFGSSLLQPGFLKAESLALLFTSQKTTGGQPTGYGFGWFIEKSKSGKRIYDHSGGSVGGTAWLMIYPDTHIVVALISNVERSGGNLSGRDDVSKIGEAFERSP
jgi:CubicO group peptidase (beta-lactamase class C family)